MSSGGPQLWTDTFALTGCNSTRHLLCFDIPHECADRDPCLRPHRIISQRTFDAHFRRDRCRYLCQNEATSAGLTNASSLLALLSTTSASAATRFDLSMGSMPYVRPDGIKIADATTIAPVPRSTAASGSMRMQLRGRFGFVAWTGLVANDRRQRGHDLCRLVRQYDLIARLRRRSRVRHAARWTGATTCTPLVLSTVVEP